MREIFMDTAALIALGNRSDADHGRAREIRGRLSASTDRIVTSQWVLTEFLNSMSAIPTRGLAGRMVDALRHSDRVVVIEATAEDWTMALDFYRGRSDKEWSLVDCTSILACQLRSIQHVFTNDRHFVQAGLEILMS